MGVLAQAKNGDQQFLEIEISCNQWEGSACTQSALILFFLSFGWWWSGAGRGFFSFFLCSQDVPFLFPSGSQYVPYVPSVFPKGVPNSTSL